MDEGSGVALRGMDEIISHRPFHGQADALCRRSKSMSRGGAGNHKKENQDQSPSPA
jgi:hypothetical protein